MKIINPSFNYDEYGQDYSARRRPDPEIEKLIFKAIGDSSTIINIGAGTGSYEPHDRFVVAVEPSPPLLKIDFIESVENIEKIENPTLN
ncbi:MAG: hypothetical protein J7599_23640 [Niabella sp.]|nr:hypothetical protein [Niabella sp.]